MSEDAPEQERLARDWIALWQSEFSALALDREAHETWRTLLGLWARTADAMPRAPVRPDGGPHDRPGSGPDAAAGAATVAAAPDPRDAEIDRLARRVDELERRLAGLERGDAGGDQGGPRKRSRR